MYRLEIDLDNSVNVQEVLTYLQTNQTPLQVKLQKSIGSILQKEYILKTIDGRWCPHDG